MENFALKSGAPPKRQVCHFPAKLLWDLQPFVEYARDLRDDRFAMGSIFVEPSATGGALIGAVSGHAMAVFHDPEATCTAPVTLDIPDLAFDAAKGPDDLFMPYCGEKYLVSYPDWMQPGDVWATSSGLVIMPRMRHPMWADEPAEFQPSLFHGVASVGHHYVGMDYHLSDGFPVDWKKALRRAVSKPSESQPDARQFHPHVASLYTRIVDRANMESDGKGCRVTHRATGPDGAVVVTIENRPDFVGTYMPQSSKDLQAQSVSWHFLQKAATNG